eukprot:8292757-Ditylum_brightwellii.AAC.1
MTNLALLTATEVPGLLSRSEKLATLPASICSLGLHTSGGAAIAAFVIPMVTVIRYAIKRITLQHKRVMVDTSITALYTNWQTSELPLLQLYRTLMSSLLDDTPLPN